MTAEKMTSFEEGWVWKEKESIKKQNRQPQSVIQPISELKTVVKVITVVLTLNTGGL